MAMSFASLGAQIIDVRPPRTLRPRLESVSASTKASYIITSKSVHPPIGEVFLAFCVVCHGRMVKAGKTSNGRQRLRCLICKLSVNAYSARQNCDQRASAVRLLRAGKSLRRVAASVGVDTRTVFNYSHNSLGLCGCGREFRHPGWCAFRGPRPRLRYKREKVD